jgi:D-serine deaminase-like pyridoxal phosphate-dependent protein
MRLKLAFAILLAATVAHAKEPRHYQSGKLMKMESVYCGTDQKNGKSLAGEMIGTDSAHMKTKELLCQEYVLQTEKLTYTIRPKDEKHPALLPVGEKAQFRIDKDKVMLRVEDMDDKEREYLVISMTPRESDETVSASKSVK